MGRQEDEPGSETETDGAELKNPAAYLCIEWVWGPGSPSKNAKDPPVVLPSRCVRPAHGGCDLREPRAGVDIYIYNGLSFVLS